MGLIEELVGALFGELFQGLSLGQTVIEIVLVGGFIWFILSKFWWKPRQAKKAAEVQPEESPKSKKKGV